MTSQPPHYPPLFLVSPCRNLPSLPPSCQCTADGSVIKCTTRWFNRRLITLLPRRFIRLGCHSGRRTPIRMHSFKIIQASITQKLPLLYYTTPAVRDSLLLRLYNGALAIYRRKIGFFARTVDGGAMGRFQSINCNRFLEI